MIKESCLYYKKYKDMGATVDWCQNYPHLNFDCEKCKRYIEKNFVQVVRCKDCRHAGECHKSVQYTRNEPNTVTIGYSPIEWCSRGERRERMPRLVDANEILKSEHQHYDYISDEYYVLVRDIENAPTINVKPQSTWFTVEEQVPNNDDWVIVTILDESGDTPYRYTDFGWYLDAANCWIVDAEQRHDVVAWMPLPKPYKRERKADEPN